MLLIAKSQKVIQILYDFAYRLWIIVAMVPNTSTHTAARTAIPAGDKKNDAGEDEPALVPIFPGSFAANSSSAREEQQMKLIFVA